MESVGHHLRVEVTVKSVKRTGHGFEQLMQALDKFVDIEKSFVTKRKR